MADRVHKRGEKMPIEIKGILCPQCGGTDIQMESERRGMCNVCGSHFLIYCHSHKDDPDLELTDVIKSRIHVEFSKQEFLRKAWIDLNIDDAPAELFETNFGEVVSIPHQIVMERARLEGSFQASVGHDRQEPYIITESYLAREGDRNVKKERLVTKFRTVTDWQAHSGNTGMQSVACTENSPDVEFDDELFLDSFCSTESENIELLSAEKDDVEISEYAKRVLEETHNLKFESKVYHDLPGDHSRNLNSYLANKNVEFSAFFLTEEYRTSIFFHGIEYSRYAFPFGNMKIGGNKIENDNSMWNNVRKIRDAAPHTLWRRTKLLSLLTFGGLLLSIIVNLFIHITALTVLCFMLGVAGFIWNTIDVNQKANVIQRETNSAAEQYQVQYRVWRRGLLNRKLASLGLLPVAEDEEAE